MVAGTWKDGALVRIGATGVRRHSTRMFTRKEIPFTIHDKVHIRSCTKAMTATVVAMLMEHNGLLSFESTLGDILGQDKFFDDIMHPNMKAITANQLLHPRSGLDKDLDMDRTKKLPKHNTDTENRRTILAEVLSQPPRATPDTDSLYSNVGYILLGYLCEHLTGQSYADLMQERLFDPLRMTMARFGPSAETDVLPPLQPWGHVKRYFGTVTIPVNVDNPSIYGPPTETP
jgi:CubicO group peptidase (beta-lactamase class C family)